MLFAMAVLTSLVQFPKYVSMSSRVGLSRSYGFVSRKIRYVIGEGDFQVGRQVVR